MAKKSNQFIIGVDGGGTKTIAALSDMKGKILIQSTKGPSNPRNVGLKTAVSNISRAIESVLKKGEIISTAIALPAMEEEYKGKKNTILRLLKKEKKISRIFKGKVRILSDQLVAFRAGTDKKDGIVLIAGTGCVAHGWKKKKDVKVSGWGWLADRGSAFWVGQRVFQVILRDLDKRGPETILSKMAFQTLKIKNTKEFLKKNYSKNPTKIIPKLSIICDKAIQKGDKVAKGIMVEAGKEVALNATTVISRMNFQKIKFPLILVGSMFKTKIFLHTVKKEIKKSAPKAQIILLIKPPVNGSIKIALEEI
ncbi:N-acetylglucosamine kinase [Patescibacteria group bacterium]